MKILIVANSRFKGGTSGGDKIYESFIKYWPKCDFKVSEMLGLDYKPFFICYLHRIVLALVKSLFDREPYDIVYSASDFLPDSLAGMVYKIKGRRWVAGFYLKAFKENRLHFLSQKLVIKLIEKYADMVIVTNTTMYDIFPNKKKTWINGGIDTELAGLSDEPKIYDAVFVGRIHPSKGIDELIDYWDKYRTENPMAMLAVIGDGDLGVGYIKRRLGTYNITYFGFLGDERYDVYKQSRTVLNMTPEKYDHFSMSYVEAMACGCKLIYFNTPVNRVMLADYKDNPVEWASQFDYKKQSQRVYYDIRRELCGY